MRLHKCGWSTGVATRVRVEQGHPLIGGSWGRGDASHFVGDGCRRGGAALDGSGGAWQAIKGGGANFQLKANFIFKIA